MCSKNSAPMMKSGLKHGLSNKKGKVIGGFTKGWDWKGQEKKQQAHDVNGQLGEVVTKPGYFTIRLTIRFDHPPTPPFTVSVS